MHRFAISNSSSNFLERQIRNYVNNFEPTNFILERAIQRRESMMLVSVVIYNYLNVESLRLFSSVYRICRNQQHVVRQKR